MREIIGYIQLNVIMKDEAPTAMAEAEVRLRAAAARDSIETHFVDFGHLLFAP